MSHPPPWSVARQGIYEFQNDFLLLCRATTDEFRHTEVKSAKKQNVQNAASTDTIKQAEWLRSFPRS